MNEEVFERPSGQPALAVPVEPASGLAPSGFDQAQGVAGPYWISTATNGEHRVMGRHGKIIRTYPAHQLAMANVDCTRLQRKHQRAESALRDAAPDLLEAIKIAMEWIKGWDPGFIYDDEWPADQARIEAAIRKAEGL